MIGPGEAHRELRDAARAVLAGHCPPAAVRAAYDDPEQWRALWKSLVDLGWPGFASGESGLGLADLVTVLEESGAATLPAPLLSSIGHSAGALHAAGDAAAGVLAELAEGAVGTLLATAAGARLPGAALRLSGGRVTGTAGDVAEATRADLLVGLSSGDRGVCLVVLRPGAGVEFRRRPSVDPSRPVGDVVVDAVPETVLPVSLPRALARPLLASAAELVGVADRALAMSVAHAGARHQFGRPIGTFQAVKHRLADGYVALERARSLVHAAVAADGGDDGTAWRAAALAKAAAAEAALGVTRAGVGVHGAIAQSWEHDMHLLLRRAWLGDALLGGSRALYAAVARAYVDDREEAPSA